MCYNSVALNMSGSNKAYYPPRYQRQSGVNDAFVREPPKKQTTVFNDINTLLLVLKTTGLFPIYEQLTNYEVGPPTKPNEFYSFFVRGVVHALTVFNLYNLFTSEYTNIFYSYRDTENINQWIELVLFIITFTLTIFICARNSKAFLQLMNEILQVDNETYNNYGVVLSNNCGFSVRYLVGVVLCHIYIVVLKIFLIKTTLTPISYALIVLYALQNGLCSAFIIFTSAMLRIVTIRFAYLNNILDGYSYVKQTKLLRNFRRFGESAFMAAFPEDSLFVYRMHNRLLHIYKSINECCSIILVGFMGYAFYTITTTTYNLFVEITTEKQISLKVLQWCMAWLGLHVALLSILSRNCGEATREANTTSQILARVYGKSKEYQNIIDKFLTKSIKQEVQFTAYGFFVIDNSTLFKIFSAVTTYLVILIQFKQLEDSKMEDQAVAAAIEKP